MFSQANLFGSHNRQGNSWNSVYFDFRFFSRRLRYYGEDKSWINFGRNRTHIPYNFYPIYVVVVHWREK